MNVEFSWNVTPRHLPVHRRLGDIMFTNLKISVRIFLGFATLVTLIALLAGLTVVSSINTDASVAELTRTSTVIVGLKDALLSVRQGRVQAWTYMATGEEAYAKARDAAFDLFKKRYAELEIHVQDPAGKLMIKDFDEAVIEFEAKARAMNDLKQQGVATDTPEYRNAVSAVNEAAKHYADADEKAANFEADLGEKALAATNRQINTAIDFALGAGLAGVLLGIGIAWFIGRGIVRPITLLTGAMDRLAADDL